MLIVIRLISRALFVDTSFKANYSETPKRWDLDILCIIESQAHNKRNFYPRYKLMLKGDRLPGVCHSCIFLCVMNSLHASVRMP